MNISKKHLWLAGGAVACFGFAPSLSYAQVACLPIDDVYVHDVSLFPQSEVNSWVSDFEGRCLGLGEFNSIMERVTEAYVDAGYITSRAYLPEQDLADGSLEFNVVEGRLERVVFNGEPDPLWQSIAFPGIEDRYVNIREVEQGLDVIRMMPSYQVEMEFEPGEEAGDSVLQISAVSEKPWRINTSFNNYGQAPLGEYNSTIGLEWDNVLGQNDIWSISYTKALSPTPFSIDYDGPGSESLAFNAKFPYGKWLTSVGYNYSRYKQEIDGTFTPIPMDGWSNGLSLNTRYMWHRDQESKTYLRGELSRNQNKNYIMGTLIESSSRTVSSLKLGISDERPIWDGYLQTSMDLEMGLDAFGAEDHSEMPKGQPDAQYRLLSASANYARQWEKDWGVLAYDATLSGQLSQDRLYYSQQFTLGGVSTVRGTMSSIASGSSGILARQEIEWKPKSAVLPYAGQLSLYAGLDWGHIFEQKAVDVERFTATGGVLGLKLKQGLVDIDFSYGDLMCLGCKDFSDAYDSGVWMLSVSKTF